MIEVVGLNISKAALIIEMKGSSRPVWDTTEKKASLARVGIN